MAIVMDMDTGRVEQASREFGAFQDEVLNAQWLPDQRRHLQLRALPECQLGLQEAVPVVRRNAPADPEAFLRNVYLSQE